MHIRGALPFVNLTSLPASAVATAGMTNSSPSPAKPRGICPSCNTRRMMETAAHLIDHVFLRLPMRQWVLSVPKLLSYFMQRDGAVLNMVLRIFLRGHRVEPICQPSWCWECGQRSTTHWRCGFYSPLWLQPERLFRRPRLLKLPRSKASGRPMPEPCLP